MASIVPRQTKTANLSAGANTTISATFDSATINGNLVVIHLSNVTQKTLTVSNAGVNKRQECGTGNLGGAIYDITADGTAMTITATWTTATRASMTIMEFDAAYTYDTSIDDETNTATVGTSQPSGTITAAGGATLGVVMIVGDLATNIDGGGTRNYTNSWTEQAFNSAASCPGIASATKDITGGGSQSTTYSVTDTGDEMYGAIASYILNATTNLQHIVGSAHLAGAGGGLAGRAA